jgi:hypothetical protein
MIRRPIKRSTAVLLGLAALLLLLAAYTARAPAASAES